MIYNLGPVGAHQVIKFTVLTIFIKNNLSKNINMLYPMLGPFRAHQVMIQK